MFHLPGFAVDGDCVDGDDGLSGTGGMGEPPPSRLSYKQSISKSMLFQFLQLNLVRNRTGDI